MTEADFWARLEYRLCHEFAGMADRHLRHLWCDGFIPRQYLLDDADPRIVGRVWIGDGRGQEEWDFTLFLPRPFGSLDGIDWRSLLPPANVTRWLALDRRAKRLQIEPGVATADAT